MIQVPDPYWKVNPDVVGDESAEERYEFDEEEEDDDDERSD